MGRRCRRSEKNDRERWATPNIWSPTLRWKCVGVRFRVVLNVMWGFFSSGVINGCADAGVVTWPWGDQIP